MYKTNRFHYFISAYMCTCTLITCTLIMQCSLQKIIMLYCSICQSRLFKALDFETTFNYLHTSSTDASKVLPAPWPWTLIISLRPVAAPWRTFKNRRTVYALSLQLSLSLNPDVSHGISREDLFNHQAIPSLVSFLSIFKNFMLNQVVAMQGEFTCCPL